MKQFRIGELDSEDEAEVPADMMKAKDISFEKNDRGHFILPPLENYNNTKQRQRVVRGYVGAIYRQQHSSPHCHFLTLGLGEFTGHKRAAFPYLLASKEDQKIYSPECVPEGFSLSDPDHLTGFKISNLYNHWLRRQQKKLQPFIVLNSGPLHHMAAGKSEKGKGKKKVDWEEVSTSSDGGESENEDAVTNPPKFGPPRGAKSKTKPSTQLDASLEAGPSRTAPGKKPPKSRRGNSPLPDSATPRPVAKPVSILSVKLFNLADVL